MNISREKDHFCLKCEQWLPKPPEAVFPFFSDAHNLEKLTPDLLNFHVLTPSPIEMKPGTLIDYKLKVRGIPMRWRTEILEFEPQRKFIDTQLKGPYKLWHHTHLFEPKDGGTLCTDIVKYLPPGGPFAGLINKFMVERDIRSIFKYRTMQLEMIFGDESP